MPRFFPFFKITAVLVLLINLSLPLICSGNEIQYVSDILIITLREGPSTKYKIIKTLKTDTPLEILESKDRYHRVRTDDGTEGWVLQQYVSSKTPKAQIITNLKEKVNELEEKLQQVTERNSRLETEIANLKNTHTQTKKELESTTSNVTETMSRTRNQLEQITLQYNTLLNQSKNVVAMTKENETLISSNNKFKKEIDSIRQENTHLKRSGILKWFLAGAGVLLIGFIAGKMGQSKKKYY